MVTTRADFWSATTAWARRFKSPLHEFLRTKSGGAAVLLPATAAALVWVNVDASSGGMGAAGAIYLAFNLGSSGTEGWGSAMWVVALESGIEPLVVGLAFGLLVWATPAARSDLEHAGKRFREFREQPTPELQHMARESIRTAMSPNERLQLIYHPWTSYVIVPLFALANAGIAIDGDFLERAADSPITLGVLVGYVAGKPLGIVGAALLVTWLSRGRLRPTAGWGAVAGAGASAGVGFTVSLLIATLAFHGAQLKDAKVGILAAPVGAAAVTWLVFRIVGLLSQRRRIAALLGGAAPLLDLG